MKYLRGLKLSTEAIRFQNDALFRDLTALIAPFIGLNQVPSKSERGTLFANIAAVIKRRTNLTIVPEDGYCYAIGVPDWNEDHVLMNNWKPLLDSGDARVLLKDKTKVIKGSVDLEKVWVEGFFAEHKFPMYMDMEAFADARFKAIHHAGALVHEIGHAFTMCEMVSRTVETNQVLSRMLAELHDVDASKRKVVIGKAGKELGLNEETIASAADSTNTEVVTTIMLTSLIRDSQYNTRSPYYNFNSAEQMADEFAARMGAGAAMIEFLHLYGEMGKSVQTRSNVTYIILEVIKLSLTILSLPLGATWVWIFSLFWVAAESSDTGGMYDTPAARYNRVRRQIIEGMKNHNISKEMNRKYQEDLQLIDGIVKQYTDRQQFWGVIYDYIFQRKAMQDKKYQQDLEALAANDLYIGAQLLKHL